MIFPQEKRDLIKYLDKNVRQLHWPDWVTAVIRQLVEESDSAEKRIAAAEKCIEILQDRITELSGSQAKKIERINEMIVAMRFKLRETGWALNTDGEWVKLLPCDPVSEMPEETLECWM